MACESVRIGSSSLDEAGSSQTKLPFVRPKRLALQAKCPEACAVCGDQATGFHYDVASCNGCKTFFRRTLLDQRRFLCSKDGKCFESVHAANRCSCRSCRFEKCVAVGMNPIAIISSQDVSGNLLIQEVMASRERMDAAASAALVVPSAPTPPSSELTKQLTSTDEFMGQLIDGLLHLEIKHESLRRSTYNPRSFWDFGVVDILSTPSELGKHHEDMPDWPLPYTTCEITHLPVEVHIRERIPIPQKNVWSMPENVKQWAFADLVYVIEYIKTFPFFNSLPEYDKIVMLRNSVLQCSILTCSFFSYERHASSILYPDGRIKTDMQPTMNAHVIPLLIRMKLDKTEYVILKALLICNPAWSDLSDYARTLMTPEWDRYARTLLSCCLARRGVIDGPATFASILGIVEVLSNIAQRQKDLHTMLIALNLKTSRIKLVSQLIDY